MELLGEEKILWEKIEPYLVDLRLPDDAPQEIKDAAERLHEMAWDPRRGQ